MSGYGSIRAMQDSLKENRRLLKRDRKSARELADRYRLKKTQTTPYKKLPEEELEKFRRQILDKRLREHRRNMVILILLTAAVVSVIVLLIY